MVQGQDLLGDGVNVAARLQTAAEPGGICISGSVHDQIRNKLSMTFQSLGERAYKNIAQPVRTFSVVEAENGAPLPSPNLAATNKPVLLVSGVGVALLLLLGGGYWAYTHGAASSAPAAQNAPSVPVTQSVAPAAAPANAQQFVATPPPAEPVTPAPSSKQGASVAAAPKAPRPARETPPATPAGASATVVSPGAGTGPYDGVFEGPVCFEETPREARRCFHGLGVVSGKQIKGQWPMGQDTGVTMFLEGEVSTEGDIKMEMHSERSDGSRIITANFTGWIHDRQFDAQGKLRMGRPATIRWHKSTQVSGAN